MISKELMIYSLRNIWNRKTRSFLTILSIFIGILTIFIFISFGLGLYGFIEEATAGTSADKVIIQPRGVGFGGLDTTFSLTDDDLEAVKKSSGVYEATGIYLKAAEITQKRTTKYAFLTAYDPKNPLIMQIWNVEITEGRELKQGDNGRVVLGYNYMIEDKVFPDAYSLNDKIEVQNQKLRIIGFFEKIGNPQDDSNIYIINDYLPTLYPDDNLSYSWIIARVEVGRIEQVVENIKDDLRDTRNLEKGKEDFFVQSFDDMIESYSTVLNIIIGFVILIAFISVVVSSINTSTTMVTSVLERTKEIGVIKSIGARNSDVFKTFLFESGFLGFVGGVVGVILGAILTAIGAYILDQLGWGFLSPSYSPYLFIGCILFATLTGAISGVLPARSASKTRPAEALRYE